MNDQAGNWTIEATDRSINVIHEATGRHFIFWRIKESPFIDVDVVIDADDAQIDNFGDVLDNAISLAIDFAENQRK